MSTVTKSHPIKELRQQRRTALMRKFAAAKKMTNAELLEIGVLGNTGAHEMPETITGLEAIARLISAKFRVQATRQDVRRWLKRVAGPFPCPRAGNLFNVAECLDWYRREILSATAGKNGEHDLFQRAASERARGEIAAEEHKQWEREVERGAWVKRAHHDRGMIWMARIFQTLFDREIEIAGPKAGADEMRNLGVSAALIETWHQKMIARGIAWVDARRQLFKKHLAGK